MKRSILFLALAALLCSRPVGARPIRDSLDSLDRDFAKLVASR
jgi:hypothetical protein